MNVKSGLIVLALTLLFAVGCSAEELPLPEPALMVPISSGAWQMIVYGVGTAESLKVGMGGGYGSTTTYTPKEGYAFLIVDVNISKVDPTSPMRVSTDEIALLDDNNSIHIADGGGHEDLVAPHGVFIVSKPVGAKKNKYFSSDGRTLSSGDLYCEEPFSFVFIVKSNELNQRWRLQFQGMPLIPLKLGDSATPPPTTECGALSCSLPKECGIGDLKAETQTGLVYQVWAGNTLTSKLALFGRGTQLNVCKGSSYRELKVATDGAILLQASPQRGWRNLYLIEPGGRTSSLVRNARIASGEFMPGTSYVIITVVRAGKQGWQLYVYDRKKGAMTLLYEGTWYKYSIFSDGVLLLQDSISTASMGPVENGSLPVPKLPRGDADDITSDGKHVIVSDYIANLDGSGIRQISGGPVEKAALSPDGRYLLFQRAVTAANTKQAFLYNFVSRSSQPVTPNGGGFVSSFSPDGKWAAIVGTFPKAETDKSEAENQVMYLIKLDSRKMVTEVHGEIVNSFFSPDGVSIGYTTKSADGTLSVYAITLATGSAQKVGQASSPVGAAISRAK